MLQLLILILGLATVILLTKNKIFWGSIVGLISEPLWFITSAANGQWGVFVASIFYAVVFIGAIKRNWRNEKNNDSTTSSGM